MKNSLKIGIAVLSVIATLGLVIFYANSGAVKSPAKVTETKRVLAMIGGNEMLKLNEPINQSDLMKLAINNKKYKEWTRLQEQKISNSNTSFLSYFTTSKDGKNFYMIKYFCDEPYTPNANLRVRFYKAKLTDGGELNFAKNSMSLSISNSVFEESMKLTQEEQSNNKDFKRVGNLLGKTASQITVDFPAWYEKWDGSSIRMITGGNKLTYNAVNLEWNQQINGYEKKFVKGSQFERWLIDHFSGTMFKSYFIVDDAVVESDYPLYTSEFLKSCLVDSN